MAGPDDPPTKDGRTRKDLLEPDARAGFREALKEQDERLSLADCRQLAAIAEIDIQLGLFAQRQERMANASRQLIEDLRAEIQKALAANRMAWEGALARQEERFSLALRQGEGRYRKLIEAMARLVQPFAELGRELDHPPHTGGARPGAAAEGPGGLRSTSSIQAASPSQSVGVVAYCDWPGVHPVIVQNGHLPISGWALSHAGIEEIQVLVDGQPRENLAYGTLRPDVAEDHPQFPDAEHSGFIGTLAMEGLADGEHTLILRILVRDGTQTELTRNFRLKAGAVADHPLRNCEYEEWLKERTPSEADLRRMRTDGETLLFQPTISLLVPVYNTPEAYLRMMADSVLAQTYGKWELCLVDNGSTAPHVQPFLARLAERDPRSKVVHLAHNQGITGGTNAALAMASGEFIGLLDSDDVLMPSSLYEVVRALNEAPGTDLVYSDEDKVNETGEIRWDPFFKPDWSPDLLLSMNYVCHFGVYRRSLVEAIGGFRASYEGSQDYDMVLRFTERTDKIVHVPSILYSWRAITGSGAADSMAKPHAVDAARRAVADAIQRRGVPGRVEQGCATGRWRVRYEIRGQPAVTLVIPSGGKMRFFEPCLQSVLEKSTYPNLHVQVIDNSGGTDIAEHCSRLKGRYPRLRHRVFRVDPFNYPALNNFAMTLVDSPYVVLLNDDTLIVTPDWVEAMLEHAQRPEVGVVGAKLLYPDRSIQHAGVILGPYENCGHAFKHFPDSNPRYFDLPRVIRNYSAVTFACAMMRRSVYEEVGGLDDRNLAVAFNDVDMCLRIRERGYRVIYTPHAVLFHLESVTKNVMVNPGETDYMQRRWGAVIRHDPFYNPNLTREGEDYSLNFDALPIWARQDPASRLGRPRGETSRSLAR